MPEVRQALDAEPRLWRLLGNLAKRAEDALIGAAVAEQDLAGQEAARRYLADLRAQRAGPDPSLLERAAPRGRALRGPL